MRLNEWLRLLAGTAVLITVLLGAVHSPYWFLATAFVGPNLVQSAYTRRCPAMAILRALGVKD